MIGWPGRCEVHEQFTVEEIANAVTHGAGVLGGLVGAKLLIVVAACAGAIALVAGLPLGGLFVWLDRGTDLFDTPGWTLPVVFLLCWIGLFALAVWLTWRSAHRSDQ